MSTFSSASGAPIGWTPPSVEELHRLLPQYEIDEILGRGGMGAVYKGRQSSLGRTVAIKLLPDTLAAGDEGDQHQYIERFKLEARSMANLDHPAIVSVHDFGQTDEGHLYFIMEFIDGMDIEQYIHANGGIVEPEHALAIVSHVLDALDYAHSKGIVHRDIKPANVLINSEGRVKIADFGLAKAIGDDDEGAAAMSGLTMTNMAMGTPDYIAPEALDSDAVPDHRADLYSVGVMLYKMLTGKLPRGIFKLPSEVNKQLDPRFDELINLGMAGSPDERFQSASEFRSRLGEMLSQPVSKIEAGQDSGSVTPPVSKSRLNFPASEPEREPAASQAAVEDSQSGSHAKTKSSAGVIGVVVAACVMIGVAAWFLFLRKPASEGDGSVAVSPVTGGEEPAASGKAPMSPQQSAAGPAVAGVPSPGDAADDPRGGAKSSAPQPASKVEDSSPGGKFAPMANPDSDRIDGLVANGEWQDLLSAIAARPFFSTESWQEKGDVLVGEGGGEFEKISAMRGLETEALTEYEARMRFSVSENVNAVAMFLPHRENGMSVFAWEEGALVGIQEDVLSGIVAPVESKGELPFKIGDGEIHEMWVSVSADTVAIRMDGRDLFRYQPQDWSAWSQIFDYGRTEPPIIGFKVRQGRAEFHSFEVRIPGPGETFPSPVAPVPASEESKPKLQSPAIPELQTRLTNYRKARKQQIDKLVGGYRGALERGKESAIAEGDLDVVEQVEVMAAVLDNYRSSLESVLADDEVLGLPAPAVGGQLPANLVKLEAAFRNSIADTEIDLQGKLVQSFKGCETTLTRAGKIDEAKQVRDYRSALMVSLVEASDWMSVAQGDDGAPAAQPTPPKPLKPLEPGWVELFNGRDLDGWSIKSGFAKYAVENGEIVGRNVGNSPNTFLCTDASYGDFELEFEVKLEDGLNSGVQIRSLLKDTASNEYGGVGHGPQIEIESGPGKSGRLYGEATGHAWLSTDLTDHNHFRNGEWNHFRVVANGPQIQTWVNGKKVEDQSLDNIYSRYSKGFIGLQVHRAKKGGKPSEVRWRNIRLKELDGKQAAATGQAGSQEWTELFNGRDLTQWRQGGANNSGWEVKGGAIWNSGAKGENLRSKVSMPPGGVEVEGEFRTSADGNGGVILEGVAELALVGSRGVGSGGIWTGGVFGAKASEKLSAPSRNPIKDDTWTSFRLQWTGATFRTWVDGKPQSEVNISTRQVQLNLALQSRVTGEVAYRNLRMRKLDPLAAPEESPSGLPPLTGAGEVDDWRQIFNGSDLDGWKVTGNRACFSVENGAIKAKSAGSPAHLFWTGGGSRAEEVKNFEMRFSVRAEGPGPMNSGIYFHSSDAGIENSKFPLIGMELQLATVGEGILATGGLFKLVAPKFIFDDFDDWFDVSIKVEDKRVHCHFDGRLILDYTEPDDISPGGTIDKARIALEGGAIAIQANSSNGAWYFKDIQFRELE